MLTGTDATRSAPKELPAPDGTGLGRQVVAGRCQTQASEMQMCKPNLDTPPQQPRVVHRVLNPDDATTDESVPAGIDSSKCATIG